MFKLAADAGVPLMSCSSLRYAENLTAALDDKILSCDIFGPVAMQETQPGWFWYGVHCVEVLNRTMGRGCKEVRVTNHENGDVLAATFADGRMASIHGLRGSHHKFGITLHREKDFQFIDLAANKRAWYTTMLEAILNTLPQGKSDVAAEDTLEIVRIIEACNKSRQSGDAVKV
jgi:predicted dehydrogenase